MAEKQEKKKTARRKPKQAVVESRGLGAKQLVAAPPPALQKLQETIEADGGTVLGTYRDPLGGNWQILAGLPLGKVQPTPYQRDLSETHVARLAKAIDKLDRFLDPVIAVRSNDGTYWTPNGYHRLGALRQLGAKSIVAIVVPDQAVAHRILALNTEKAHNLRERALEVTRLEHGLAELDDRPEKEFETEFEEPALLTLGLCYQQNGRFSGSVYQPILKRIDEFLAMKLSKALEIRRERARRLLELDEAVSAAVAGLKARGFQSPYLKAFVVARINFLRFKKGKAEFGETLDRLIAAAKKFDISKVKPDQVATAAGGGGGGGGGGESGGGGVWGGTGVQPPAGEGRASREGGGRGGGARGGGGGGGGGRRRSEQGADFRSVARCPRAALRDLDRAGARWDGSGASRPGLAARPSRCLEDPPPGDRRRSRT